MNESQYVRHTIFRFETIFQLYHGDQWWRKLEYPERTTDHGQATGKLYHLRLRVECTLFRSTFRRKNVELLSSLQHLGRLSFRLSCLSSQLFSPASCTTKTGRHDITEILLKVALKHQKSNQNQSFFFSFVHCIVCSSSNCGCILSPFYFVKLLLQPSNTDN
jgi:hypothetical protein